MDSFFSTTEEWNVLNFLSTVIDKKRKRKNASKIKCAFTGNSKIAQMITWYGRKYPRDYVSLLDKLVRIPTFVYIANGLLRLYVYKVGPVKFGTLMPGYLSLDPCMEREGAACTYTHISTISYSIVSRPCRWPVTPLNAAIISNAPRGSDISVVTVDRVDGSRR